MGFDIKVRGHAQQAFTGRFGLGAAQRAFGAEHLPVQVAFLEGIRVAEHESPHAGTGEKRGRMAAQAAASGNEHAGTQEALQPFGGKHGAAAPEALGPETGVQQGAHGFPFRQARRLRHGLHPGKTHERPLTASGALGEEAAKGLGIELVRSG